jgi:hypothetical protein
MSLSTMMSLVVSMAEAASGVIAGAVEGVVWWFISAFERTGTPVSAKDKCWTNFLLVVIKAPT